MVIPYLQRQFEALEVHDDGRLFGIRRDREEEIDQGFYNPELLEDCLLAKCPISWDTTNRKYILAHGMTVIDWEHYKHPLPENVYDTYMRYWRDIEVAD